MSKIPKRGYKLPVYEGGRLPIHNSDGGGNDLDTIYSDFMRINERDTVYIVCLYSLYQLVGMKYLSDL